METLTQQYDKTMRKFERSNQFGVGMSTPSGKHKPVHVNATKNPMPCVRRGNNGGLIGDVMVWTKRRTDNHLRGLQPGFHVSRDDRNVILLGLDFDGELGSDLQDAANYARLLLESIGIDIDDMFVEPGRSYPNKGGCYVWIKIKWSNNTDGPTRRVYERALARRIKAASQQISPVPGIEYDDLKGTTSYIEDNPNFDPIFASGGSGRNHMVYEVGKDVWLTKYEARKMLRGLGFTPSDIDDAINSMATKYEEKSNLKYYNDHKRFYAVDVKKNGTPKVFHHDTRLEKTRRHFGVLVTKPCYGALSGDRPNNIAEFVNWANSKAGIITHGQLKKIIGPDGCNKIAMLLNPERVSKRQSRKYSTNFSESHEEVVVEDDIDNHSLLCNRVYKELRWLKSASPKAQAIVVERAVDWYEQSGIATGDSPAEHAQRLDWAGRIAAFAAETFDANKIGAGPFAITPERVATVSQQLRGRIPKRLLPVVDGRRMTYERLAMLLLAFTNNIARGNIGEVPHTSILGLLKDLGASISTSMLAASKKLLIQIGQLVVTRKHYAQANQCTKYLLGPRAIILTEHRDLITPDMQVQVVAQIRSVAAVYDRHAADYALPLPPLTDNYIKEHSIRGAILKTAQAVGLVWSMQQNLAVKPQSIGIGA